MSLYTPTDQINLLEHIKETMEQLYSESVETTKLDWEWASVRGGLQTALDMARGIGEGE